MPWSFGEVVERSLDLLERRGRVSHNALRLEFDLSEIRLAALVEELVLVLEVADDDGTILTSRAALPPAAAPAAPPSAVEPPIDHLAEWPVLAPEPAGANDTAPLDDAAPAAEETAATPQPEAVEEPEPAQAAQGTDDPEAAAELAQVSEILEASAEAARYPQTTEPAEAAQAPEAAAEPGATESSETADEPAATEEPALAEEPAGFPPLQAIEEPAAFEMPAGMEEPPAFEVPAAIEEPPAFEVPADIEEPAATEVPAATEEPAATEMPAATEEPAASEVPAAIEEAAAAEERQTAGELETVEEPAAADQPQAAEEPEAIEEPAAAGEPRAAGEPDAAEEPAANEEPPTVEEPPASTAPATAGAAPDAPAAVEESAGVAPPATDQPPASEVVDAAPAPSDATPDEVGVAVLLCELVFDPPPEALELEAHAATTSRVHSICNEVARRFDAHAQPWVGDGVAVFFGHPRPHGDEAQRAVRCGWELVRAIDAARGVLEREHEVSVRARIAIAAGTAARDADDPFGNLPHLAAGVQAGGDTGTVTIDDATFALVASPESFQPAGKRPLSHDAAPVALHRLVKPLGGAPGSAPAHAIAPLFGRSGERALLRALADRARAGTRSAVMLRGESGIGKTRIVQALRDVCTGELGMAVLQCQCSPYHRGSPLRPILHGLHRHDPARSAAAAAPKDDTSPGRARREQLGGLSSAIADYARHRPLLVVVEDLQWADPTTLELLGMLIAGSPELPLLLVLTARQDVTPLPGAALQLIDLPRLGEGDLRRVVAAAAAGGALADDVVAELAERASGSPLLAEELTRTMLATQDSEDRELIPATLYGCLMARLNRDDAARTVARVAATIGREFDLEFLRALGTLDESELDWGLERLLADGVVRPGRDEGTYAFRHVLLQDVARSSLRRGALRAHNLKIARTLLERFPEIAEAEPERVARHLEYAGELLESVGHWQRAARDAEQRGAYREAAWHLERALMLTSRMASTPQRVALELELRVPAARAYAAVSGHDDPVAAAHRLRAVTLGGLAENTPQSLPATLGLTRQHLFEGRIGDAFALAKLQALAAKGAVVPELQLATACTLGSALLLAGQPKPAIEQLDRALELYDPARDRGYARRFGHDPAAIALTQRALALALRDDAEGARAATTTAAQILRARRHPFSEAWVHCGAATAALVCGERDIVGRESALGLEIATREGFAGWRAHASVLQGWTRALEGDRQSGLDQLRAGVAAWDATGAGAMRPWHACLLAGGLLACGEIHEGLAAIDAGLVAIEGGERWCEPELHRLRAELLRAGGETDRATGCAQQALVCARKMYATAWERRATQTLAGLAGMPRAA